MVLCRIGWHKWSKWRLIVWDVVKYNVFTGVPFSGKEQGQARNCEHCGLMKDRTI